MVILVFHLSTYRIALIGFDEYRIGTIIFCSVPVRNRQSMRVCRLGTEVLFFWVAKGDLALAIPSIHVLLALVHISQT